MISPYDYPRTADRIRGGELAKSTSNLLERGGDYIVVENPEEWIDRARRFVLWRRRIQNVLFLIALVAGGIEAYRQYREDQWIGQLAAEIVQTAQASTPREKVLALRDYLHRHVTFRNAPIDRRSFLRATAWETIESGLGYCGEVTRAFINMSGAIGIRAQRINLWGAAPHVVAEAELAPRDLVIVDCQYPPAVRDLERLDQVIQRPEWDDYYTLNLRRLHISWLFSRVKMEMGLFTYWTENPHALKAMMWFSLVILLGSLKLGRAAFRIYLKRRGWVHISNVYALKNDKAESA